MNIDDLLSIETYNSNLPSPLLAIIRNKTSEIESLVRINKRSIPFSFQYKITDPYAVILKDKARETLCLFSFSKENIGQFLNIIFNENRTYRG